MACWISRSQIKDANNRLEPRHEFLDESLGRGQTSIGHHGWNSSFEDMGTDGSEEVPHSTVEGMLATVGRPPQHTIM